MRCSPTFHNNVSTLHSSADANLLHDYADSCYHSQLHIQRYFLFCILIILHFIVIPASLHANTTLTRTFTVQTVCACKTSRFTSRILWMGVRFCEDLGTVGNISRESSGALALKLNSTPSCFQSSSYLKGLNQLELSKSTQLIWHELWGEKGTSSFFTVTAVTACLQHERYQ